MRHYLLQSSTAMAVIVASLVLAGAMAIYLTRRGTPDLSRTAARYTLLGVIVWLSLEYFMGRFSPLFWGDEANLVPPILNYFATYVEPGQLFAHGFLGGVDRYSMLLVGSSFVSIEMTLTHFLPMWAVVMVNKVASHSLGLVGMYLLCRKIARVPRFLSIVAAGMFFLADPRYFDITLIHGPAWGSLPAVAFLTAYQLGRSRRSFIASLFGLAALFALLPPTHMGTGAGTVFIIAAVCFYNGSKWRLIAATLAILLAVISNWHEVLWAFLQVSTETYKFGREGSSATFLAGVSIDFFLALYVVAMGVLFMYRDRLLYPGGSAIIGSIIFAPVLKVIIGFIPALGILLAGQWGYSFAAIDVFGMLIVARAAYRIQSSIDRGPTLRRYINTNAILFGFFLGMTLFYKGAHIFELIHKGGHAHFTSIENLKNREWEESGLHRVVTLRGWDSEPNIAPGFYGLDAFDGHLNLAPRSTFDYWSHGIYKIANPVTGSSVAISASPDDWSWEDLEYDLNAKIRTRSLRAVNVQYVLSWAPIKEEGLKLVSGPDGSRENFGMHRNWSDKQRYYANRIKKIDNYGKIFIYRLKDAVPRAFGAEAIDLRPDAENVRDSVLLGVEAALAGRARIAESSAKYFKSHRAGLTVRDVVKTKKGYLVHIDAPEAGAVVLNVPFTSFWRAHVDNVEQEVIRANFVQMVVVVPKGAEKVEFIYARPLLRDVLADRIFGIERP